MSAPSLHIALVHPQIGPNTGNIGRLCLGIGARLHLVHPLGFRIDEKLIGDMKTVGDIHSHVREHFGSADQIAAAAENRI